MKYLVTLFLFLILSCSVGAKTQPRGKLMGVFYLQTPYAHIHSSAEVNSESLTTLSCGHPIKVYEEDGLSERWHRIKVASLEGYIKAEFLSRNKVNCLQDRYVRFFSNLKLEISDLYYWGKLYDQFLSGRVGIE